MKLTEMTNDQIKKEIDDAHKVASAIEAIIKEVQLTEVTAMRQLLDCMLWFETRERIASDILKKRS